MSLMVETTRRVFNIQEDIPLLGIVAAEKAGWEARQHLRDRFHFPEDGRIKFTVRSGMSAVFTMYSPIVRLFHNCVSNNHLYIRCLLEDSEAVVTNTCPDGSKLTKHLLRVVDRDSWKTRVVREYAAFKELLPALPSDPEKVTLEAFLAVFFEAVQSREIDYTLSCNPADYMEASYDASFKSCYSPGGQYEVAPLQYATSPDTLICFGRRPGSSRKVFRAWVYVNADMDSIIIGRLYGNIPTVQLTGLMEKIAARGKISMFYQYLRVHTGFAVRFKASDAPVLVYSDTPAAYVGASFRGDTHIRVTKTLCAACGEKRLGKSNDILCATCAAVFRKVCSFCGEGTRGFHSNRDGEKYYCASCLESTDVCPICGERHYKDHMHFDPDGTHICQGCFDKRYTVCRRCSKLEVRKKGSVKGLCTECAANIQTGECCGCGAHHDIAEHGGYFEDKYYCNNCLAWTFAEYIQARIKNGRLVG